MSERLAYLVSRFPLVSETFILREMIELERRGWPLDLFALHHEDSTVRHERAAAFEARAQFLEPLSAETLRANIRLLQRAPGQFGRLYSQTVRGNLRSRDFLAKGLAIFPGLVDLASRMRRRGVRHIHAHFGTHPALAALLAADLIGTGFSFTVHAHDLFVDATMLAEKVRRARFVATISEFNRQRLIELAGPDVAGKVIVVRCGVDLERYAFRARMPPGDGWRILAVASLREYKGLEYLVRACGLLRADPSTPPFTCEIVGGGPLQQSLEHLIADLGLTDCVRLLGPQDEDAVRERMKSADTFVLPSIVARNGQMEGIPVVLMEAMALGLPVIVSELSGIPELVRNQETGLLVPPADSGAIRDAILACWRRPGAASHRAQVGRALVEREYDLIKNVGQLDALFKRVMVRHQPDSSPVHVPVG